MFRLYSLVSPVAALLSDLTQLLSWYAGRKTPEFPFNKSENNKLIHKSLLRLVVVASCLDRRCNRTSAHSSSPAGPAGFLLIGAALLELRPADGDKQHAVNKQQTWDCIISHKHAALTQSLLCSYIQFLDPALSVNPLKTHLYSLTWRRYKKHDLKINVPCRSLFFVHSSIEQTEHYVLIPSKWTEKDNNKVLCTNLHIVVPPAWLWH